MMTTPDVSIVMPVFNAERYLRESIGSVLGQTFRNFELIVIDDGSRDGTAKLLDSLNDARVVRETFTENQGLRTALNRGLKLARGRYVARQDADDVALPQRLEKQVRFLDTHTNVTIAGSAYLEVDEHGNRLRRVHMPVIRNEAADD